MRAHNYQCAYCGKRGHYTNERLHRDHEVPLSRGGPHHVDNIVPACARCNLLKGAMTGIEFRALITATGGAVPTSRRRRRRASPAPTLREQIKQAVEELSKPSPEGPWTTQEIVEQLRRSGCEAPLASIRSTISTMGTRGELQRTKRGAYRPLG